MVRITKQPNSIFLFILAAIEPLEFIINAEYGCSQCQELRHRHQRTASNISMLWIGGGRVAVPHAFIKFMWTNDEDRIFKQYIIENK